MKDNSKFLARKANEVAHEKAVAPTPENMSKNISRMIESRDRMDQEFIDFVSANNMDRRDQNGVDHIPITRAVINEMRVDAAAIAVTSAGTETGMIGADKFNGSWSVNGVNQSGVHRKYCSERTVQGVPVINNVGTILLDSQLGELEDGDLANPTISSDDMDIVRSMVGSSYSGVRSKINGNELSSNVIQALNVSMDMELDRIAFSAAYGQAALSASIGTTPSAWKAALMSEIYSSGFSDPKIIGSYSAVAALMSAQTEFEGYGTLNGIEVIGSQSYAANADQLLVVDGSSSVVMAEFELTLMLDRFTSAQSNVVKHLLMGQHACSILDQSGVLAINLA